MVALLPRLRRFAYALTGNWPDADDLVQETCVRAINALDQWDPGTRLDSWMYRIAQNLRRNSVRNNRLQRSHLQLLGDSSREASTGHLPTERLRLREVSAAMKQLPAEQRAVMLLVAVEGYGYREAGDILGLSPGTIASRLSRARTTIAEICFEVEATHASG